MSATATQTPFIPPRPSRNQDKESMPKIPPRPINRRVDRSVSPNPSRFAPSPLNDGPFLPVLGPKSPRPHHFSAYNGRGGSADPIERSKSVDLPSLGEEGQEYAGLTEELEPSEEPASSPEHTRTVGDDIKLHAPKPSLPAQSAKARVAQVTRTDSDRAASFGIGKPSSEEPLPSNRSLKKKASTVSQLSTTESHVDDELGIPEIGQQVPMYPNAGDVQAPSPAPGSGGQQENLSAKPRHHSRRTSARGFVELPPGSYGLHGHGILSQDKLEKAYYDKHPELRFKEHTPHHHDRPHDFSMSREDLNKIVHDTASRGSGNVPAPAFAGTPSEQIGWQAIEETTSRVSSVRPESAEAKELGRKTTPPHDSGAVHVEEPGRRRSVMFSDDEDAIPEEMEERPYTAPILAEDEVAKDPSSGVFEPAVELPPERRGSAFEMEEPRSRPTSRPASIYRESPFDKISTPLEDVQEYEPLFPEEEKQAAAKEKSRAEKQASKAHKQRFPSRDIWEDAPTSLNYTAEVSTPEPGETQSKPPEVPQREAGTPAQVFARKQEELAEKESNEPESFLHRKQKKAVLNQQHLQLTEERPQASPAPRFPSRDVWEDSPDSLQLEATVSTPQESRDTSPTDSKPPIPQRPVKKHSDPSTAPAVPERPKPKSATSDDGKSPIAKSPPNLPDRPKPQVPARPAKAGPTSGGQEPGEAAAAPPKTKPAVPVRPVGSKIAALQAGFMSDLNKRLQLGPQAPKKEEPASEEADTFQEKEKAPLADARKGRARGPQRRAPRASPSPAASSSAHDSTRDRPVLSFSSTCTVFSMDPDSDIVTISSVALTDEEEEKTETKATEASVAHSEPPLESEPKHVQEPKDTPAQEEAVEKPVEQEESSSKSDATASPPAQEQTKSLASNTAGETLVEAHIEQDAQENVNEAEAEEGPKE